MSEQMERILTEALQSKRPVLVNPTEDEIRRAAEGLRLEGRLICTACRKPIREEDFHSERISFGPRLQAIVHLHETCRRSFADALAQRQDQQA